MPGQRGLVGPAARCPARVYRTQEPDQLVHPVAERQRLPGDTDISARIR